MVKLFFRSSVFDSESRILGDPGRYGGGGESIWVSHEYGFEMFFFFLYFSLIRSLGLEDGGGSVNLGCFISLSGSWFFI